MFGLQLRPRGREEPQKESKIIQVKHSTKKHLHQKKKTSTARQKQANSLNDITRPTRHMDTHIERTVALVALVIRSIKFFVRSGSPHTHLRSHPRPPDHHVHREVLDGLPKLFFQHAWCLGGDGSWPVSAAATG